MRILYIVPGFNEGGVESHVLHLIRELVRMNHGHEITLAFSDKGGGRLEHELPGCVQVLHLPVEQKNPFTVIYSAIKLSRLHKKFHWDIIHAHSRVPAFVSWILSSLTHAKWLMTAHALYSLNLGILPLRHADGVICVSEAVRHHLENRVPDNTIIIPNGIIPPELRHSDFNHEGMTRFLFVGRLTRLKGLDVALSALSELKNYDWTLDVLGEGPHREELEELSHNLGISERVTFHGNKDSHEVELFMAKSSCLLFPSFSEGMGLSALEAMSMGLPVIASDLEALHEFADGKLIPAGDVDAWREAVRKFLCNNECSPLNPEKIITINEMAVKTEKYYERVMLNENKQEAL